MKCNNMFKFKEVSKVIIGYKYNDIKGHIQDFRPSERSAVRPITFEEFLKSFSNQEYYKRKTWIHSSAIEKFLFIMTGVNKNYVETLKARMNKAAKTNVADFRDSVSIIRDYHSYIRYYRSQPKK